MKTIQYIQQIQIRNIFLLVYSKICIFSLQKATAYWISNLNQQGFEQPLNVFSSIKNICKRIYYTSKMHEDIETKHCQDILRKNNLYVIKKLGKGAFGIVYLVSRANLKANEAQLFSVKCTNKKNFIKKPMLKRYLKQQIDIQSGVNHPNVVKLIRTFEDQGWNFMIMEYCDVGNIYNYQSQKPKKVYELNEAKKYMADVLDGLKHLHSNNIIHRDLKLENVLLMRDSNNQEIRAKICDFGFAKAEQQASTFCGTTYFMAPQIFAKKKYDSFVDIWSAGVILFYMLFAAYPFKSMNMANQIQTKCKDGFKMENVKGMADNQSISKEDKKILAKLFQKIFRIQPNQRITISQFRKYMTIEQNLSPRIQKEDIQTISSDTDQEIQFLSQKIVFMQKVYQQVKNLQFLSNIQELAFKYYLDKYCLTLILINNKLCSENLTMSKIRKQLQKNQQKDAALLIPNLHKIDISKFSETFTTICSSDFSTYKEAYRIVLSHIFSKANRLIDDLTLRSQMKLKIFCCHSINRVFQQQFVHQIFVHFFNQRLKKFGKKAEKEFKLEEIMHWIEQDNPQKINDTVKLMCDKFYKKSK